MLSYAALTCLACLALGDADARREWLRQVPSAFYDRAAAVFGTALVIDVLNSLFELRTTKLDFVLLPCFVKGMATTTNLLLRGGAGAIARGPAGRM